MFVGTSGWGYPSWQPGFYTPSSATATSRMRRQLRTGHGAVRFAVMEPRLDAIGIVTADMAASCRFYALLGVPVGDPPEGDDHFEAALPSGIRLMWDSVELMKRIDPSWQPPTGHPLGLAFHCGSATGVDETHAAVVAAGFTSKNEPWDAFWGQRYAQVVDPDGNAVHLFAPLGA